MELWQELEITWLTQHTLFFKQEAFFTSTLQLLQLQIVKELEKCFKSPLFCLSLTILLWKESCWTNLKLQNLLKSWNRLKKLRKLCKKVKGKGKKKIKKRKKLRKSMKMIYLILLQSHWKSKELIIKKICLESQHF